MNSALEKWEIKRITRDCGADATHKTGRIFNLFQRSHFHLPLTLPPSSHPFFASPRRLIPSPRQINFPAWPSISPATPTPTLSFVSRRDLHFQRPHIILGSVLPSIERNAPKSPPTYFLLATIYAAILMFAYVLFRGSWNDCRHIWLL